ncbi:hypothetical protein WHI96_12975 [Pseudonocardia tropica]|uniref:Uncharacterized protein n=1 Tax=Pseudonocardia tropica TaxID=681289 RepID=A0ABV1JUV7_9PSEU
MSSGCDESCRSYADGHRMHHIRSRLTGESPWGWRDAIVTGTEGTWLTLDYVTTKGRPRVRHHAQLDTLPPGTPVRLHERFRVLGSPTGWITVEIENGIGPVPEPENPSDWADAVSPGIVHLRTGHGLSTDHRTER